MIDLEFIERAQELYKTFDNRAHHNEGQKRYFNTEKGIFAKRLGDAKRRARKKIEIKEEEKSALTKFYKNCPDGYEVDHIIPLSRGGLHELSNLQYLTKAENRMKGAKIDWKRTGE